MTPPPVTRAVPSSTRQLLRPFNAAAATLTYFAHTFSRLFQISWFPFLLTIACIVALAALVHAQPPLLPDRLYFREWDPPTWLKVVATAPFAAMVLSYVLREMSDRYADRGAFRIDRLGFELSRPVLAAALLLAAFDIWVGVLRLARRALGAAMIIGLYGSAFNEADVRLWIVLSGPIKAVLEAIAAMWCYLLAGLIVTAGRMQHHRSGCACLGDYPRQLDLFAGALSADWRRSGGCRVFVRSDRVLAGATRKLDIPNTTAGVVLAG